MRKTLLASLLLIVGLMLTAGQVFAQERFGGLTGTVVDQSGGVLPGVTVNITNKTSGQIRSITTGSDGSYILPDLEPGHYSVRYELTGFSSSQVEDVNVLLGQLLKLDTQLKVGNLSEVVNVSAEAVPVIDIRNTTVAHNVTAEELDRLPKTRSFQQVAVTSPSVNSGDIENGIQINGASNSESAYIIDGVVTNSLIDGRTRQDTVSEYLQEIQIKTAGISAEYGGALGGVISAVTKSGGNTFTGEGHYYFSGNAISSGPVQRLVLATSDDKTVANYQDVKQPLNKNEVGGSLGGPIIKNKLFFFGSVSPRYSRRSNLYHYSGGTTDGEIEKNENFMSAFGKISWTPSSRVNTSGSVLYTPTSATGLLPAYNGSGPNVISSSFASNQPNITHGFKSPQTNMSGQVDFTLSNSSLLSVRGGYFRDDFQDTGVPTISSVVYQTSSVGLSGVPASAQGPVGTQNTPRVQVTDHDLTQRAYYNVDFTKNGRLGGDHNLKVGFGQQHTSNDVDLSYPGGGYVFIWWDSAFTSNVPGVGTNRGTYGYYEVNDNGTRGAAKSDIWSLYAQDQWNPTSRLTVNLGIRTEREVIPSFRTDIKEEGFHFGFADKIAPRLGFSYDMRGDGKVKIYASYGRYYDWTKYELARGAFGADVWNVRYRSLDTTDVFSLSGTNMPGRDLWNPSVPDSFRDRRVPNFDTVAPDLKPMRQDNINGGLEYQLGPASSFGVRFTHNNLNRTIEDMGVLVNGDEVYQYVNPGEGIAADFLPSGPHPSIAAPRPKRQYDALELTWNKRFSNSWFGSASYVLSRLYGNYPGLSDSDEIRTPTVGSTYSASQQLTGTIARQGSSAHRGWDLDEVVVDSHGNTEVLGRLATDRPHVVKLYGAYSFPFGTLVGVNFYAGSGTPLTTLVGTINQIPVMVEGRGDMGRTPMLNQTDLLVSHQLSLGGNKKVSLELNVLNLFNQKTVRHIFTSLNRTDGNPRQSSGINLSNVDLSQGFDYVALLAQSADGKTPGAPGKPNNAYDPRFGLADLWNPGLQAQIGLKFLF